MRQKHDKNTTKNREKNVSNKQTRSKPVAKTAIKNIASFAIP